MKRVLCLFLSLVFLVCFVGSAAAADGFAGQYHEIECAGHDEAEPSSSRYDSDRIKRKTFTHPLQDINGAPVAVMTVTVVGMYSQVDHYCSSMTFFLVIRPESATTTKSSKRNLLTKSSTRGIIVKPSYWLPQNTE